MFKSYVAIITLQQQYLKQGGTVVGKQTAITRAMTEVEMNALLKRQQQQKAVVASAATTGQVTQMQLQGQTISPSASPQLLPQTVQVSWLT
jgi:hypothetical protein